jgi:hypothetical protein
MSNDNKELLREGHNGPPAKIVYGATKDSTETETEAAVPTPPNTTWSLGQVVFILTICGLYILASATLILFNKYLMHPSRFPFAWVLTGWHILVTFSCCVLLHLVFPKLFTSAQAASENILFITKYFPVIATLFVFGAVLSNIAYLHCSVPFLQFMKEWNIGMVFLMSLAMGSQSPDRVKFLVIVWIMVSASLSVTGEMHFSQYGFIIQLMSQVCETTKAVTQEWIMGGKLKLDPLTYQLCMCPFALVPIGIGIAMSWDSHIEMQALMWWPYILANGFCAFLLNISVAAIIKYAGAIGFLLAAIVKDICIVLLATHLNHDELALQQIIGFVLALLGILYWGLLSAAPDSPLVTWLPQLLGVKREPQKANWSPPTKLVSHEKGKV